MGSACLSSSQIRVRGRGTVWSRVWGRGRGRVGGRVRGSSRGRGRVRVRVRGSGRVRVRVRDRFEWWVGGPADPCRAWLGLGVRVRG